MENQGTITIDGYPLTYLIEGEGVPVMVIGSAAYYSRLFSKELRNSVKLIFIDHRGHAPSPADTELMAPEALLDKVLDDIETIRNDLGLKDFVIAGHSGNAFLAVEYALKYPAEVRQVVLLNTATSNSAERQQQSINFFEQTASSERKHRFEQEFALLPADIEREPERRFAHMCIRFGAHSFFDYDFDATSMWDGVYTNMPILDTLWGEAFAQLDLRKRLGELHTPVFLALGRHDYLVGPYTLWDGVEDKYPNIRKVLFDRSGHNPMMEEPELFDAELKEWLCSLNGQGS
ncbi:alpha/beta fold hydrolase [Paenibacillus vini]|uniref:AB hydrolase superfamily protein YclE n=1 Tax=Paenibacillus vini TaxID=1476024 RepID=A0ABQ4MBZ3_9BACL|nr:alpha/beta hydrolase [Paenibacillus vini]GIP53522.1 AB hydrolase superfamily protein YclE [Paenibacillus vini]